MTDKPDAPAIYTPETPDPLRDGLYRGFYAHLNPPREPPKPAKDKPTK
jgi:hypothetical protein